eukprot:Clim_evm22s210 gene=Clim_evmTU22s210
MGILRRLSSKNKSKGSKESVASSAETGSVKGSNQSIASNSDSKARSADITNGSRTSQKDPRRSKNDQKANPSTTQVKDTSAANSFPEPQEKPVVPTVAKPKKPSVQKEPVSVAAPAAGPTVPDITVSSQQQTTQSEKALATKSDAAPAPTPAVVPEQKRKGKKQNNTTKPAAEPKQDNTTKPAAESEKSKEPVVKQAASAVSEKVSKEAATAASPVVPTEIESKKAEEAAHITTTVPETSKEKDEEMGATISVGSMNCALYDGVDSEGKKHNKFDLLAKIIASVDVCCLQEVFDYDYCQQLANRLPDHYNYFKSEEGRSEGVAIFSKYPIDEVNTCVLNEDGFRRVALQVQSNGIWFVNVHLDHENPEKRERQLKRLVGSLKGLQPVRYVIAGDFNDSCREDDIDRILYHEQDLKLCNLTRPAHLETFMKIKEHKREMYTKQIDHIFANEGASISDVQAHPWYFGDGDYLSDHKFLSARVKI